MASATQKNLVQSLLELHGRTYAADLGIHPERGTPAELHKLLVASILFSARIGAGLAEKGARALFDQGWTTADKLAKSTWRQRTDTLNRAGYARYDERTSSMLGDTAELLVEHYRGDLRRLREEAGRNPQDERRLLKAFKGLGDVGVDIFFREVQLAWDELYPFADAKALQTAGKIGLPDDPKALAGKVSKQDYPRLVAALVRLRGGRKAELNEVRERAEAR